MMKRRHLLAAPAIALLAALSVRAADKMDPPLMRRARRAVAGGLHCLRGQQAPDGSLLKSVGIPALALRAFLESPEGYSWSNLDSNAWWEDRPQPVTAWSVIALEHVLK